MSGALPRVAFLSSRPLHGGSQQMLLQLAAGHQARGGWAHVLAPGPHEILDRARALGVPGTEVPLDEALRQYGGALVRLPRWRLALRLPRLLPFAVRLHRWLRRERVDVLYVAEARAGLLAVAAARLAGVPLLLHVQGGASDDNLRLTWAAYARAARLLVVSHAVRDGLHAQLAWLDPARTAVMYNGLPDVPPAPPRPADDVFVVLAPGRLSPQKGVHHLVRALALLPSDLRRRVRLDVLGRDDSGTYRAWLERLAEEGGVAQQVRFVGFVDDVDACIAASDVIACPSIEDERLPLGGVTERVQWKEGFCLAAAEAMRAGRPVVASDSYGLREVVEEGVTGLRVPVADPQALADALATLAADPELRARMGRAGRARFVDLFTLDRMLDAFEHELQALAPQR